MTPLSNPEVPAFETGGLFDAVSILGIGLMGGSLGKALKSRGLARRVVGYDLDKATLAKALRCGAIDVGETDLRPAVREADLVVVAVPVGVVPVLLEAVAPLVRPRALVTDLGSVKSRIVETGTRLFGDRFVGGHPMAGSEESGIEAAQADLFSGAAWAVVRPGPFEFSEDEPARRLAGLIEALGAKPLALDSARHDRLVALVSHLPHALSFAFAQTIGADSDAEQANLLAAGSYRDMTRISRSDPGLWRDIFLDNRESVLEALALFEAELRALKSAIVSADADALLSALTALSGQESSEAESGSR